MSSLKLAKSWVSLALALFISSPLLLSTYKIRALYVPAPKEDSDYYLAKTLNVSRGDLTQTSSYFESLTRARPINFEFFGELVLGFPTLFFDVPLAITVCILTLICLYLQIFSLQSLFLGSPFHSALVTIGIYAVLLNVNDNVVYRLINPIFPITLLLVYMRICNKPKGQKPWSALTVIIVALPTSAYFGSVMLLHFLYQRLSRRIFTIFMATTALVSFLLVRLTGVDESEDLWRWGAIQGHTIGSLRSTVIGLICLLFSELFKNASRNYHIVKQLLVISLFLTNSQLLTGIYIENSSHFGFIVEFLSIILWALILGQFLHNQDDSKTRLKLLTVFLLIFSSVTLAIEVSENTQTFQQAAQNDKFQGSIFVNSPKDCKTFSTTEDLAEVAPKFTTCSILYGKSATNWFSMSNLEVLERWYLNNELQNFPKTFCSDVPALTSEQIYERVFERRFHNLNGRIRTAELINSQRAYLEMRAADLEYVSELNREVRSKLLLQGCRKLISKYQVGYILTSKGFFRLQE